MLVSVIVTLCDRGNLFDQMVDSLPCDCELVVVDFESHDLDHIAVDCARAKWLTRARPFRMCYGLNEGARNAKGDILFFTHADCLHPPDLVAHLLENVKPGECYFPTFTWELEDGTTWRSDMAYGVCGFMRQDFLGHDLWWNEDMDKAWGWQDNDIHDRAKQVLKVNRPFLPGLKHLWHPTDTAYLERNYGK